MFLFNKITPFLYKTGLILTSIIVLTACAHRNTPQKTIPSDQASTLEILMNKLDSNALVFDELAARMKVETTLDGNSQSFTANMRWKNNQQIWLSFSIFGIEGIRVLMDKDSIRIIDRINKKYYLEPISYLGKMASLDISFNDLEKILLGQIIMFDPKQGTYTQHERDYTVTYAGDPFLNESLIDGQNMTLSSMLIQDQSPYRVIYATFSDYRTFEGKPFSYERHLQASDIEPRFKMDYSYEKIELREGLEFPFSIPENYTRSE